MVRTAGQPGRACPRKPVRRHAGPTRRQPVQSSTARLGRRTVLRIQPARARKPSRGRSSQNWWRQGMMGGAKAHYDGIVAFSQTDFTEDLKKIDGAGAGDARRRRPDRPVSPTRRRCPAKLVKNGDAEDVHRIPARHADHPRPTRSTPTCSPSSGPDGQNRNPEQWARSWARPRTSGRPLNARWRSTRSSTPTSSSSTSAATWRSTGRCPVIRSTSKADAAAHRVAGVRRGDNHLEVFLPDDDYRDNALVLTTAANNALMLDVRVPRASRRRPRTAFSC